MDLLSTLVIGLIAGWLGGRIMKERSLGLGGNLVVGVIGAFIGWYIFYFLDISIGGIIGSLASATLGAVVLLYIIQMVRRD